MMMNWNAIIAVTEVIGVIAIIASLVYVAAQIRQNNVIARATIISTTNSDSMRISELIAQDAELAAIYEKGSNGVSLTSTDLRRFLGLVEIYLAWLENVDSQNEVDLYFKWDEIEDVVVHMKGELEEFFSTPEVRQWWTSAKPVYRPSLARKIDQCIDGMEN
jgi:hypothetical protein